MCMRDEEKSNCFDWFFEMILEDERLLKKDITFVYMDTAEMSAYEPIAEEAKKRGYQISFTDNKLQKCEIGFYCQHVNFPQFSKFSVIMLHDIIQQYGNWPDIWFLEPWNKYDIGILPSDQWENNWKRCSQWYYTRTRRGVYKIGWPKADAVVKLQKEAYRDTFYKEHGMDENKKTILYAPAWENDNKQDEFVQSMLELDVNILIKQAAWNEELYPDQVKNIKEMYELHKNVKRVTILPPSTNIFTAIAVSDILVSEESSTMCEATMMGIPAVSVSDWLIPDTTPSRYPKCDYDFVTVTTKAKLTECISDMVTNYEFHHEVTKDYAKKNFLNIGKTAAMIMDIIDDCVNGNEIRYEQIEPNAKEKVAFGKNVSHKMKSLAREIYGNYSKRYRIIAALWNVAKKTKQILKNNI